MSKEWVKAFNPLGDPSVIIGINDGFGIAVTMFRAIYRPGDVAKCGVVPTKDYRKENYFDARFRIIRRVTMAEVQMLADKAEDKRPLADGPWYEVIGD